MDEKKVLDAGLVIKAMNGDEAAFREIYNITYQNKLFVAKKYMKNDAAAEDVLQDAYIKIWVNLPGLDKPENFNAWSSRIVANTALNELRKNQPVLFSDMTQEGDDGSELSYEVEDSYTPNQPELNYTEQEEQEIVREMINSLSDEQRICVMMYYIEELGVKEIAETLGCSEGTVKSRLNYGRKNIKLKAEELQKKGYDFKGISALALLLFLLRRQAVKAGAAPVAVSSGVAPLAGNMAGGMYQGAPQGVTGGTGVATQGATGEVAKAGAKGAFAKTAAGKAIIALMSIAAIVGTIAVVMLVKENKDDGGATPPVVTTEAGITETLATPDIAETEESTEEVVEDTEDYAYIDEYARILQENSAAIQAYETFSGLYREPEKTVAIIDAFGDTTPELFFITSDYPNYQSEEGGALNVYTMVDGKAVFVIKDTFQSVAGSAQPNKVFTSKSKEAFYWEYVPSHGVGETSDITDKIGYNIVSAQTEEHSLIYDHSWDEEQTGKQERNTYLIDGAETDEASYQSAKAGWEADYGDIIFDNWDRYSTNGGATVTYDYQYSYGDAVNKLAELKNSLGGGIAEPQNTGEMTNEKAHAMGDELIKDLYSAEVASTEQQDMSYIDEFINKYNIGVSMPMFNPAVPEGMKYAYYDINHDGIDELLIEKWAVISFVNGTPDALSNKIGEIRQTVLCLNNGHICVMIGEMYEWAYTEYELTATGDSLMFIDGARMDNSSGVCYKVGSDGYDIQEISQDEFYEKYNSFGDNVLDIEYSPMSGLN